MNWELKSLFRAFKVQCIFAQQDVVAGEECMYLVKYLCNWVFSSEQLGWWSTATQHHGMMRTPDTNNDNNCYFLQKWIQLKKKCDKAASDMTKTEACYDWQPLYTTPKIHYHSIVNYWLKVFVFISILYCVKCVE